MGRFRSSPYNFDPRVTASERIRPTITIADVTLREGQQAADVALGPDDEVEIARALEAIGVPVVQVGYAGADDASVRRIRRACPKLVLAVLLVGWKDDALDAMRSAQEAGADLCSVLFRSADAHLADLGFTRERALERVRELVRAARDSGWRHVAFGPSFSMLADLDHLMAMYRAALEAGATVIAVNDSMGTAKPSAVRFIVERMRALSETAGVRVHTHDDYGLALANALAGLEGGADWFEVSVNGLGERSGNVPLEEFAAAAEGLYGVGTGLRTEGLVELCRLVERVTGVVIPPMKPVAGEHCFANKLEIHVQAAATDRALMEPYDPALVGNRRTLRLGRGTGPTGVRLKAAELGLALGDEDIPVLVDLVNRRAVERKRSVSDEEFAELARRARPEVTAR